MKRLLIVFYFLPAISFGQVKVDHSSGIPIKLKVKPILASSNYIETKPRLAILEYLNSRKLNVENYFIDSTTSNRGDTLCIQVWDIEGLKTMKRFEERKESMERLNSTSKNKKLKVPMPIGNPGNCFTAYYDVKRSALITVELWQ